MSENEKDYEPVLSTCLYCGGPIEIKIDRKGRLVRLEPGKPDWHLCQKPRLRSHTKDKDVIDIGRPSPFRRWN